MTSQPRTRRRPGPRRALDEAHVVDAALDLLDDGGPDAVSVRGIAARLGVAPNTIYTYFPDKAALLHAIVERMLADPRPDSTSPGPDLPWRDRIQALARDLRQRLLAHRGAVTLLLGGPMDGPHALALNERLLSMLTEAGVPPAEAARSAYLLIVYVLGSIALEAAEPDQPGTTEAERVTARRAAFAAVPAEHYPHTAGQVDVLAAYITTDQFTWGLDRALDGIEGLIDPARHPDLIRDTPGTG